MTICLETFSTKKTRVAALDDPRLRAGARRPGFTARTYAHVMRDAARRRIMIRALQRRLDRSREGERGGWSRLS
jgi:hypothetical protein